MLQGGYIGATSPITKKFMIGASIASVGIPVIDGTAGVIPCTTTDAADTPGLGLDLATYSTTQATVLAAGGQALVTVSTNPMLLIKARISGSSTEGVAMTTLINTSASAGGTVITDADVGTATMASGRVWCISGNNVGEFRVATSFSSATSVTVTVPFSRAIAVGDEFLWTPFTAEPGAGCGNVQTTTLFTEADGSIVAGTGLVVTTYDIEMKGALDSAVLFQLADHLYNQTTI
jgi:hypothetical protein